MKKIIEITEELDKCLGHVLDSALKNGGLRMHDAVSKIVGAVKIIEKENEEPRQEE